MTFSEAVDITGTPQLELDFDGTPKPAACTAATITTTMACSYTVAVNDSAPNGIAIAANKLTLNGGTITATGSTTLTADLDHAAVAIDAGQKVDGIRPTLVTTGSEAPTTSNDGTQVILTFSETVTGVNRFNITIMVGTNTLSTSAARTAGTTVELDLSTVIDATVMLTVALGGSAVFDGAGNFNLAVAATTVTNAVGTTAVVSPDVSSVELTSDPGTDNTYAISDTVTATVTFSAAVDITGTPQLELDVAGTAKAAACTAAMNTTTTVCEYEVVAGDSAPNGIAIGANKLTGGTIYATGGTTTSADLTHVAVAIDVGHKVDGIRPTLVTTGSEAPKTSTDGTTVILTFSEDIGGVSRSDITIQANSVTAATSAASVTGTKVELTLTTALTTTATNLTVELAADAVKDDAGNGILAVAATAVTNAVGTTAVVSPDVSSIELTSDPGTDNTYAISDTVTATVTFSEAVDITGTPQLELDVAGTAKAAACTAATNTTTTACEYEVVAGDSAPNGIAIGANKLTGGTIYATGGTTTSADLTHVAVAIDVGHKVDGIRPTLVTTGSEAPKTSTDGTKVSLKFSETIGTVDRPRITIMAGTTTLPTTAARAAATTVVVDLTTAVTSTTPALTVALAAGAVEDDAGNGNLAVAATAVTNALATPPATLAAPDAPTSLRSTRGDQQVTLRWTAPTNDGGESITHYEYEQNESGTWTSTGGTATRYTVTGLTNGQTYMFRVRAVNSIGASGESNQVTATPSEVTPPPEPAVGPPSPPRDLTAMAGDQAVQLSWRRPAENGGAQIVRYEYRQQEGDGPVGAWQIIGEDPPPTTHRVTGLTNGTSYTFQVRAVNNRHASPPSEPASATPEPELAPFEVTIVGVPEVAVAGASYELTAQSDAEEALVYAWRVAYGEGGSVEPTDTQTVVWTAPSGVNVAWIRVDATRAEDGATAGQSAYVRVEVPEPEPEPEPVPALPLLGQLLLALGLTAAGARLLSRRPRVPPAA